VSLRIRGHTSGSRSERFSQLLALCFSLLGKETDQATGPMIMKFALVFKDVFG
jgi:hypothetical protein